MLYLVPVLIDAVGCLQSDAMTDSDLQVCNETLVQLDVVAPYALWGLGRCFLSDPGLPMPLQPNGPSWHAACCAFVRVCSDPPCSPSPPPPNGLNQHQTSNSSA